MSINGALRASASGLFAERMRMDTIASNIANANSISTPDQEAFRRQIVLLTSDENGVKIDQILPDQSRLRAVPEPDNPFADEDGMVYYSNVNPIIEMVDLMTATRTYEANVAAFNSAKGMMRAAMNIGKV
ncbi:MAG: flagellar basal body rod protein FlgC [Armatimonadetes bacterium]|nr:flagellar basal body rod protein FlgC [Armatimonadota bacterium]